MTLDLDDDLIAALLARHPELSMTEAIETAIRFYLRKGAIERVRSHAGSIWIVDFSGDLRRRDRHT
ncbi:MAG: hypothetical protein JOZ41_18790 [Chloroflexi bacterium]|nr:hypothetical protein [Chloroflexota bacterium]